MCVFLLSEIEREMFGKKMKATYENSIVRKKEKELIQKISRLPRLCKNIDDKCSYRKQPA